MATEDQGRVAHAAYADFMIDQGLWASNLVIPWSALSQAVRDAWRAAAAASEPSHA
jgi:hypothetical protein